jgi:iron complex outermembrane recepter protein
MATPLPPESMLTDPSPQRTPRLLARALLQGPLLAGTLFAGSPQPARAADPATLPGIVVVGTREVGGTPASIDRIAVSDIPARPQLSVSEVLRRVPGVAAHDRQNLAQDVQLTIRGFGARSAFGVRGLQVFDDGIPATMPDGQGQVSHIPLEALGRVEVLRGPFSALYGNASGGVIEFFSVDPPRQLQFDTRAAGGSNGLSRDSLSIAGPWSADGVEGEGYRLDAGHLGLDGYRQHSRAHRDTAQARMVFGNAIGTRVAITANTLDLAADDPQGLTQAQALNTPRAASAGALAFDTRKRVRQQQVGLHVEQALETRGVLSVNAWSGNRDTFQMLSVPVAAQGAPGSSGGVVDLDRNYAGVDLCW